MIRAGIIGISGYSGRQTLEFLLRHPDVVVTYVSANNSKGPVDVLWPQLKGRTDLVCDTYDPNKAIQSCDVLFLAVPHTIAMTIAPRLLRAKKKVIDLSADYRLRRPAYKQWYNAEHKDPTHLNKAIYGLPEIYREKIKKAALIANPGCYPTSAILGLAPLVATRPKSIDSLTIDAKSGVSGAGKKVSAGLMFAETNENFKAYKVLQHQHTPEINYYLSRLADRTVQAVFVPHLLPVNHGILSTMYVRMNKKITLKALTAMYKKFYKIEPFVRILEEGVQPELKHVVGTNYCDIGLAVDDKQKVVVITSAIDNLIKGAAGQAVQNMNLMYGFEETKALL